MASGLFFSSPLHPTSDSWQQPPTTFFTPQHTSKFNRNSAFGPISPSPLRTSKNANLMSSPIHGGKLLDDHTDSDPKQNIENSATFDSTLKTAFAIDRDSSNIFQSNSSTFTSPLTSTTSPSTSTSTPTTTPSFFLSSNTDQLPTNLNTSSSTTNRPPAFQFSSRARSSSPAHLLQSHTKDNRESRKRLFLDRLRSRRDNARSDRSDDQILRMDFMREKKQMEADMAKGWDRYLELDPDRDLEVDAEMSPVDEERGFLELATEWEEAQSRTYDHRRTDRELGDEFVESMASGLVDYDGEFSDEGYDEAFMEVLSQEVGEQGRQSASATGYSGQHVSTTDMDMDMS